MRRIWLMLVVAMVATACEGKPHVVPDSDLPSSKGGARIDVTPRQMPPAFPMTVQLWKPAALAYGPTYEIDHFVDGVWKYVLIGGQPPNPNSVSKPFPPQQDFTTDPTWIGSDTFKVSGPDEPGDYRIRKAFIDPGPGNDFEVAASFTVVDR